MGRSVEGGGLADFRNALQDAGAFGFDDVCLQFCEGGTALGIVAKSVNEHCRRAYYAQGNVLVVGMIHTGGREIRCCRHCE